MSETVTSSIWCQLVAEPIDLVQVQAAVEQETCGAVVTFNGVVRNHDGGKAVLNLSYSAHPEAERQLQETCALISKQHPGLHLAAAHRIGDLQIGDVALAVAVSSAHREAAFVACQELVDAIKAQVPIWKHQVFADGTSEWVGV